MNSGEPNTSASSDPGKVTVGPEAIASGVSPEAPHHPPIAAGALQRPRQEPVWPMVLGIISIVFGGIGVFWYAWGTLSPFVLKTWNVQTGGGTFDVMTSIRRWQSWIVPLDLLGVASAGALLAGGIGLVRRRAWSIRLLMIWAITKCLLSIGLVIVTTMMQRDQYAEMAKVGQPGVAMMQDVMAPIMAVLSAGWYLALPVFMLIWLSRPKVRATVATWRNSRSAPIPGSAG